MWRYDPKEALVKICIPKEGFGNEKEKSLQQSNLNKNNFIFAGECEKSMDNLNIEKTKSSYTKPCSSPDDVARRH
jgi:hypothetical protein